MNIQLTPNFRWLALLIIPILVGTGCNVLSPKLEPTSVPPSSAEAVITPTSAPLADSAVTPTSVTSSSQEAEAHDQQDHEHVFFEDDFTDPASGWDNALVFDNYFIGYHEPEWYHVEVQEQNDEALTVLPGQRFDDFSVEAELFVEQPLSAAEGDFRYGLVTRRAGNRFYAFTISSRTQTWYVLKSSPSGLEVLQQGTDDSIQGETEADTLRVDAIGPMLTFYINERLVSQISDPDYASGEVGFFVETFDSPRVHIHYDSLVIREAEAPPVQAVILEDDFTDPASGWPNTLVFDNYFIGYHEPEWYHVEVQEQNDNALIVLPEQRFGDFSLEAELFVEQPLSAAEGDFRYGLAARRAGKRFYAFTISSRTQTWYVLKRSPSGLEVLQQGSDDSIQGETEADTLRVDAIGPMLTFYINDRLVSQINDPDYASGEVGFFVETFDSPRVHIHYDSLVIREAEAAPVQAVFYEDDFTNPDSGWDDALVFDNYFIGYHEPEWYHVEVQEPNDEALTVLPGQHFDDFSAEAKLFVEQPLSAAEGDFRYGLVTRRAGNRFYAFTISPRTQTWYVLKSSPSGLEVLQQSTDDSIQGETEADTLRVDAMGPMLTFYINERLVSQISDPDYASGEVGFFVETFDSPRVHIHYDSLVIREAEAPPSPELECMVIAGALNLRDGPGDFSAPLIDSLTNGTRLEARARSDDSTWIQVRVEGGNQTGWVSASGQYVSCNGSITDLPVGE